jgi:apolipoprotein D and lipocalin family protein
VAHASVGATPVGAVAHRAPPRLGSAELSELIEQAERRLEARERALHSQARAIRERLRDALQPRRLLLPLAAAALAGWALWGALRRPGRRHRPLAAGRAGARRTLWHRNLSSWLRAVSLALPLLPAAWRARISPVTASAVVTLGLPLLERLAGEHPASAPLTVPRVEPWRWAGTWYEIARLPGPWERASDGMPSEHYTLRADGSFDVEQRCPEADGRERIVHGVARPAPGAAGAKLETSRWPAEWRWLPLARRDDWILHLDDGYTEALVGSPRRDALRLLSRRPSLPLSRVQALLQVAQAQGYPVERLRFTLPPR